MYLARKTTTQDLFAIKVIRKSEMVRKNMVNHVFAERTVLSLVRNPYVVKMFYAVHSRDHLFLVRQHCRDMGWTRREGTKGGGKG